MVTLCWTQKTPLLLQYIAILGSKSDDGPGLRRLHGWSYYLSIAQQSD